VYRFVYSKLGNKWDTDDVVSDVFRKAFEHYAALRSDSNPKAWLMTIARNTIYDLYRKRKDTLAGDELEAVAHPDSFMEQMELQDDLNCLKKAMAYLSEEDQELVRLKYFAELKYREVGDAVGKSEQTVKTRVFRLLKKLSLLVKSCLEGASSNG
jgi:RNA polymerase sigma-70 factor (ECF subfamily)